MGKFKECKRFNILGAQAGADAGVVVATVGAAAAAGREEEVVLVVFFCHANTVIRLFATEEFCAQGASRWTRLPWRMYPVGT